jgi:hypothetical protein
MQHGHRKREKSEQDSKRERERERERASERERMQRRKMLATTATVPFSFEGFAEEKAKGTTWGRRTDGRPDGRGHLPGPTTAGRWQQAAGRVTGNDNVLMKAKKHTKLPIPTTLVGASFAETGDEMRSQDENSLHER